MEFQILPWIDFDAIGQDDPLPIFRTETNCANPWPGLIAAFALGALVVYLGTR